MTTITTSSIDDTKPESVSATTASVRANFTEIKSQLTNAGTDIDANASSVSAHIADTANPHSVTKAQVGLTNVTDAAQLAIANNLSDLNSASTARTNLGLDTMATQAASNVAITGGSVTGITDLTIADGGTGQSTAQAAIDALTQVSSATDEYILTKDTSTGNAIFKAPAGATSGVKSITATVAGGALTCGLAADSLYFRSATLTTGTASQVSFSALSLVVPLGAKLGTTDAIQSTVILLVINNAGTAELAVVNQSGGVDLSETGVISTTALSTGSDSANVVYSTTARTNVAYRVVGYVESTQATAGTWATSPSLIQGAGGNALTSMSSLGYSQTIQDLTGSRAISTTYYNTTSRPIWCSVTTTASGAGSTPTVTIDGVSYLVSGDATPGIQHGCSFIVPPGVSYSISVSGGTPSLTAWVELR